MVTFTETANAAEFILSEASGSRSRENGTLDTGDLAAGTVLQMSGEKLIAFTAAEATDGTLVAEAAGILLAAADATDADQAVAYIARDAEVNKKLLTYPAALTDGSDEAHMIASLKLLGIIVRD
jgi:hypothetical protein